MCRWTFVLYYMQAFIWPFKINLKHTSRLCLSNKVRGDMYTLKRTIETLKPFYHSASTHVNMINIT